MCRCNTDRILTEYYTTICISCGDERATAISISPQFSPNQTLFVGYSRINRFRMILDQLFNPLIFGKPNSRVLYKLNQLGGGVLKNGNDMIHWLTGLEISDKRYQCTHYYYKWYMKDRYRVPPTPSKNLIRGIETKFSVLEANFTISDHASNSFFSYNWLLRKLLEEYPSLRHYLQFVKNIKCKHRYDRYSNMFDELIKNADSVAKVPGCVGNYQTQPVVLPGGGSLFRGHPESNFLSLLARNHQSTLVRVT